MEGIDLNQPILYKAASFRYFGKNEYHCTRTSPDDILILVFEDVLRFTEEQIPWEIPAGQYFIQRKGCAQVGHAPCHGTKYLFIHFTAQWTDEPSALPRSGSFDIPHLMPLMEHLDSLAHNGSIAIEQAAKCYEILAMLYCKEKKRTTADTIADYLVEHIDEPMSLDKLSRQFHFSKNYIIKLFKAEYQITPFAYINLLKLKKAERMLLITSQSIKSVALECGFHDYAYFYKLFYRRYHCSPAVWRRDRQI
jgi:AraC-like DNA-binding protein